MSLLEQFDFSIHFRGNRKLSKNTVLHLEEVRKHRTFLQPVATQPQTVFKCRIQTRALPHCQTNPGHVYEEITDHSTEQNDSYYSSVLGPQADGNPLYNTVQPHQHQQETHIPYTVVSLGCHRCK